MGRQLATNPSSASAGLSLSQALKRYSDPQVLFEHRVFSSKEPNLTLLVSERARTLWAETSPKTRAIRRKQLWRKLCTDFKNRLLSGELTAVGHKAPVGINDRPIPIPADKWTVLTPNFKASSAEGGGLAFVSIKVHRAITPAPADLPIAESQRAKAAPPPSDLTDEARSKGGSKPHYDAGLQQFIDQLFAEFKGKGVRLTPARLKTWLERNAPKDQGYETGDPNFDDIEFYDNLIW